MEIQILKLLLEKQSVMSNSIGYIQNVEYRPKDT